tara:strand:- start:716 stop:883 length:168 start_codon:yes stop_codon:yes gene_type:complete
MKSIFRMARWYIENEQARDEKTPENALSYLKLAQNITLAEQSYYSTHDKDDRCMS